MKNLIIKISEEDFDWFKNNDIGPCHPSIFKNIKKAVDLDDVVDKKSMPISIIKSCFESTADKFNIPKSYYSFDPADKDDKNIICLYKDSMNTWCIHRNTYTYIQYGFESGCDKMLKMLLPASEYYTAIDWFRILIDSYYDRDGVLWEWEHDRD